MPLSVEEIESTMNTYHTLYLACMVAAICFLVVALVLFIVLKIPRVFMSLTGLERRKAIKELDESVAYTNQLDSSQLMRNKYARRNRRNSKMVTPTGSLKLPNKPNPAVPAPTGIVPGANQSTPEIRGDDTLHPTVLLNDGQGEIDRKSVV